MSRIRKRRVALAVVAALALALAAAAFAHGTGKTRHASRANTPPGLARISNRGTVTALAAQSAARISSAGDPSVTPAQVWRLGARDQRDFYRVQTKTGAACYGMGFAVQPPAAADIDLYACVRSPAFPSAARPVLDFTTMGASKGGKLAPIIVNGLAADGVASVAIADANVNLVAKTPVTNNIYSFTTVPSTDVSRLVGLDATGKVVFSTPLGQ